MKTDDMNTKKIYKTEKQKRKESTIDTLLNKLFQKISKTDSAIAICGRVYQRRQKAEMPSFAV